MTGYRGRLDLEGQAVGRGFDTKILLMSQHLTSDVSKNHAANIELRTLPFEFGIVHVKVEMTTLEVSTFTHKEIGAGGECNEIVSPSAVAGKHNRLTVKRQLERQ